MGVVRLESAVHSCRCGAGRGDRVSWAVRQGRDAHGARGGGELHHGRVGRVSWAAFALTRQAETARNRVERFWKGCGVVGRL